MITTLQLGAITPRFVLGADWPLGSGAALVQPPPPSLDLRVSPFIRGLPGADRLATVGSAPLSGHSAVALDAAGLLVYADCSLSVEEGAAFGLIETAYPEGAQASVRTSFDLAYAGWNWHSGPVFLGLAGQLVQDLPANAIFGQTMGYVLSPTRIRISIQAPIVIV